MGDNTLKLEANEQVDLALIEAAWQRIRQLLEEKQPIFQESSTIASIRSKAHP